jgi:hypothetical protein
MTYIHPEDAMNIGSVKEMDDCAQVAITGRDLKQLLHYAETLRSGLSPKGEMCFQWGDNLHRIVSDAVEL